MSLKNYVTLGRSGLRVSPLCLGTMTFGTEWGIGTAEEGSRAILRQFLEAGGNFIDTANIYNFGSSEKMLGKFLKEDGLRDRVVLATKFTFNTSPGDPNAGGNGRKNIYQALEASLQRLQTDYIDLYWLHAWDTITPAEEVLSTLTDLVRAGKIRYYGFSNTPAWYVACIQTLADQQGKERLIALQLQYSLAERTIEREHIPAAQRLGLGICPWSPLAGGFFTGKYKRESSGAQGEGRLTGPAASFFRGFTDRNWRILETVSEIAKQLSKTAAQVALNWTATQPGVTSTIIGATKPAQLADNLAAIDFEIPADLRARLDEVSGLDPAGPYTYFSGIEQARISGETSIQPWMPAGRLTGAPLVRAAEQ
jgi:aryl-alcohol dehydrogenase-like predicted oxidoreductase